MKLDKLDMKTEIAHRLGFPRKEISVRQGRGTSRYWIYIKTKEKVEDYLQGRVEEFLISNGFCGSHWPDDGVSTDAYPAVLWLNG